MKKLWKYTAISAPVVAALRRGWSGIYGYCSSSMEAGDGEHAPGLRWGEGVVVLVAMTLVALVGLPGINTIRGTSAKSSERDGAAQAPGILAGIVRLGGVPCPGVKVMTFGTGIRSSAVVSDEFGAFRLTSGRTGQVSVVAELPARLVTDGQHTLLQNVRCEANTVQALELNFALGRGRIQGEVILPDGVIGQGHGIIQITTAMGLESRSFSVNEGSFCVEGLATGPARVLVGEWRSNHALLDQLPTQQFIVDLQSEGTVPLVIDYRKPFR